MNKLIFFLILSISSLAEVYWADTLIAFSSEYSTRICSAKQVLGPPSVRIDYGLTECAWTPKEATSLQGEFIEVGFTKTVKNASIIVVHQTTGSGVISDIVAFNKDKSKSDTIYKAIRFTIPENDYQIFKYYMPKIPEYPISSIKLNLLTYRNPKRNYIESIALLSEDEDTNPQIKTDSIVFQSKPINLGVGVNTSSDELAPIINAKGDKIYFVRTNYAENFGYENKQDIWYSELEENGWFGKAKNVGQPLNNEYDNYAFSLTPDENSILLGNIYRKDEMPKSGISISYKEGENWKFPEPILIRDYKNYSPYSNYFLANDGKTMILAFEGEDSKGCTDLYLSRYDKFNNEWSKPENIEYLNTAGEEYSPFLAADGKTLYFSSNSYPGYGSADIYVSRRLDNTWKKWSDPTNLGDKINSPGFDAYLTIPANGEFAYFVSSRNSIGYNDIFKIKLPESLKPEKVVYVVGKAFNKKDSSSIEAKIYYERLSDGELLGIAKSNPRTGEYKIVLPKGEQYGIRAERGGFLSINENLDLRKLDEYEEIYKDLSLVPIEKGQKIRLNNTFFDFAKIELHPNSFTELNRIVKFMRDYPDVHIQIEGHTDNVGTQERNLKLSQKRAKSVADYLNSKGINANRLKSIGYGKSKPLKEGESEIIRKLNRRVELTILK